MNDKVCLVNILEPRRTQSGIFRFMTRDWHPTKTQVLDKNYTPQDLKDITARSLYLEAVIEAESAKSGVSKEKLKEEVLSYIEEIGLDKKMHVIRWLGMFAIKVAFTMNIGIYVNEPAILKIKAAMGKNPVLFLPTHRSYADFCILTYLCYHYDIEFPAVASGMDFHSMAVVGSVLRQTCAFYLRRSLVGAPLYAAALRRYVRALVAYHPAPLEFFLEGTRSRSNKSLPPKYGMLAMAMTALAAREVADITVVPVNISYDRLMEQTTFAYEHLGVPKPKESTTGLLKWLSTLNDEFGNMYLNFGEPISAKEYLKDIPQSNESLKPLELQELSPEQRGAVRELGDAAVARQQEAAVASAAGLLALALGSSLVEGELLPRQRLLEDVCWLRQVLVSLGATIFEEEVDEAINRILRVHARYWQLDGSHCLRLRLHRPDPRCHQPLNKGVLDAELVCTAIPVIQLQLYINPLLHYLMPPALLTLIAAHLPTEDELRRRYRMLRKLLWFEFFHLEKDEEQTFESALEYCVRAGAVERRGPKWGEGSELRLRTLLRRAAWPSLATLGLCADVVHQRGSCEKEEALVQVQQLAVRQGVHPYCLSRSSAALCLRGLQAQGALTLQQSNKSTTYNVVPEVMAQCRELINLVVPHFDADFSCRNPVFIDETIKNKL